MVSAELETVAVYPDQYPEPNLPEIALAGRSNVGKSSLLNAVMNRRNLARTSSKPGKTRTINFYNINSVVRLVDLPGYGYAVASKKEKEKWAGYIDTYLTERENLKAIFLILDIRHAPSALDVEMYRYIQYYEIPSLIVATKADKIARGKWDQAKKVIRNTLGTKEEIFPFSSEKKYHLEELRQKIETIIE
ncbi:MAG: ribosome biogenesis GTP-binding protein YihA/YsxC [Tissierellia bacterium]|nr:ribosome biogenesis GTP-binding protein YihA/YsxC [Tissierellia bacterium]